MRRWERDIIIFALIIIPAVLVIHYGRVFEREKNIEEAEGKTVEELFDDITFSSNDGLLQQIKPIQNGDDLDFIVYLPNEMETDARAYFPSFEKLVVSGNHEYTNGDTLCDLSYGISYDIQLIGYDGKVKGNASFTFYQASGIPTLYIQTDGGTTEEIDADKSKRISGHFMTIDADGTRSSEGECHLKARGQSSFGADQKPYNMKTGTTVSPFGMDEGSEWALLSNYSDSTQQLRNKFTFDMARRIGLASTPDSRFCNVYIDGEYRGMYLLAQRATIDGGSVHIHDLKEEHEKSDVFQRYGATTWLHEDGSAEKYTRSSVSADDVTGGYLLQLCARYEAEENYFTTGFGQPVVIKNPKNLSSEEMEYITDYVRDAVNILSDLDSTDEQLQQYFDYDSWTRIYLMQDFAVEWDLEFDSFKFYKEQGDPLLYAGPIWDFDLAYGTLYFGYYPTLTKYTMWVQDDRGGWLRTLAGHEGFMGLVRELYRDVFSPAVTEYLDNEFLEIADRNEESLEMSCVRWGRSYPDYKSSVNELYTWLKERQAFLDDYLDHADRYSKVSFEFAWGTISYYVKTGEALGYLPLATYGEIDSHSNEYGNLVNWEDGNGGNVSADTVISEDTILTAVYEGT